VHLIGKNFQSINRDFSFFGGLGWVESTIAKVLKFEELVFSLT